MRPWIRSLSNILPKRPLRDKFLAKIWLSSKVNLFGIWKIQIVEQVQLVKDPILPASETFNQTFNNVKYCKKTKICIRLWDRILHETCFVYNSTQKASPEELQVRIFMKLKFAKICTYSSSVDYEFNIKKQLLPKKCMRPWIRSLSHISPKSPQRE